jgi:hypothetical protein
MTDITSRLAELGETLTYAPSDDAVASDLARGRATLRCNRLRVGGALSVAALAIAGAAGYLGTSGQTATRHQHMTTASAPPEIQLVDYSGQQPQGFKVKSVPQGFGLQRQEAPSYDPNYSAHFFVLAPPSADKTPADFVGKLIVYAEAGSELGNWQSFGDRSVTVNGAQGRIGDQDGATALWFTVGKGVVVNVVAYDSIGLTDQQVIDFADGVSTTPALKLSCC